MTDTEAPRLAIKFLTARGTGPYSGYRWPLPTTEGPGEWVEATGELHPCENGVHAVTPPQASLWIDRTAYLIELQGEIIDAEDKLCARRGRLLRPLDWTPRAARLFAADCVEGVLSHYEACRPGDDRVRRTIEAVRRFARGDANVSELRAAENLAAGTVRSFEALEAFEAMEARYVASAAELAADPDPYTAASKVGIMALSAVTSARPFFSPYEAAAERNRQGRLLVKHLGATELEEATDPAPQEAE